MTGSNGNDSNKLNELTYEEELAEAAIKLLNRLSQLEKQGIDMTFDIKMLALKYYKEDIMIDKVVQKIIQDINSRK